jgi:hypothetical protein
MVVDNGHQNRMHSRDQAGIFWCQNGWQVLQVLVPIENRLDFNRTVADGKAESFGGHLLQLFFQFDLYGKTISVDANGVQPKMKIPIGATFRRLLGIVAEAIAEMLVRQDIALVSIPNVEKQEKPVASMIPYCMATS